MSGLIASGNVYISVYDSGELTGEQGPFNASNFSITPAKSKTVERTSYGRDDYGSILNSVVIPNGVSSISITIDDATPEALALFLLGNTSSAVVASGSAADEVVVAHLGKWSKLAHRNVSDVVVKDSTKVTTYVLNTDYTVDAISGMIKALSTGAIDDSESLKVSYDYAGVTESKVSSGKYIAVNSQIRLDGTNLANSKSIEALVYEANLIPEGDYSFISEKFATIKLTGNIIQRTDKDEPFYYKEFD